MTDFERTVMVSADPRSVFGLLADPRQTAGWAHGHVRLSSTVPVAEPSTGGGSLFVSLPDKRRVEWGSPSGYYSGWMQVNDHAGGGSDVTLHVSLTGALEPDSPRVAARVRDDLESALDGLCVHFEGGGS